MADLASIPAGFSPVPSGAPPVPAGFSVVSDGAQPPSGFSLVSPQDIQNRMQTDPAYTPNDQEWRSLWNEQKSKSLLQKADEGASNFGKGIKNILSLPKAAWQEASEEAARGNPTEFAARETATYPEAVAGLVRMVTDPVLSHIANTAADLKAGKLKNVALDYLNPVTGGMASKLKSDEDQFQEWKKAQEFNLAKSRMPQSADWARAGNEPFQNAANIGQFAVPVGELGALRAVKGAVPAAQAGKTLVQQAVEAGTKTPGQALAEKVIGSAGSAVEKAGSVARAAGKIPRQIVQAATSKVVGDALTDKTLHLGEGLGLLHPVTAPISTAALGVEHGGQAVEAIGQAAKVLARTPSAGPFGRLFNMAKAPDAPDWLKGLVTIPGVQTLYKAGQLAVPAIKGASTGAAVGAGLNAANDESPAEGAGAGLVLGAGFGALHTPAARKAAIWRQRNAGMVNLVSDNLNAGAAPETLAKVPDSAMFAAADLSYLGIKDAQNRDLKIRFLDGKQMAVQGKPDAGGFYQRSDHTVYLNADHLQENPAAWTTVFHEVLHPMMESEVANRPELKAQIDSVLRNNGKTLQEGKFSYTKRLLMPGLPENIRVDEGKVNQIVNNEIANSDARSMAEHKDPNHWFYSEIMAEAARSAMDGKNWMGSAEGPLNKSLQQFAANSLLGKLGDMGLESRRGKSLMPYSAPTVIPGFENVVADPSMRRTVYNLLKAQRDFVPGITKPVEQGVKLTTADMGTEKAPLRDFGDGRRGNDFGEVVNGKFQPYAAQRIAKTVRSRRAEVNAAIPPDAKPLSRNDQTPAVANRVTPSGEIQRSGSKLPDSFYNTKSFSKETKANAKRIEQAIADGSTLQGWNQQIGKAGEDWKASVKRDTGNVEAQFKEFKPFGIKVSKEGNILVENYSLTAFDRKVADWSKRHGDLSLDLWNGDPAAFDRDVQIYLKNHAQGRPGADTIGDKKRDVVNAFLVGGNKAFESANRLRPLLKGEDRQGIIRSYRIDRLETVEPSDRQFEKPIYKSQVQNFSPEAAQFSPPVDKNENLQEGNNDENARTDSAGRAIHSPATAASDIARDAEAIKRSSPNYSDNAAEVEALYNYLDKYKRFLENVIPKQIYSDGAEHEVWDGNNGRVFKATYPGRFGESLLPGQRATPLTYLRRLALANEVFGDDIHLEGGFVDEDGRLRLITSQPFIRGLPGKEAIPTREEIASYMVSAGFAKLPLGTWYRTSDNVLAKDTHPGNFIKTDKGLVPIDVMLDHPTPEYMKLLREWRPLPEIEPASTDRTDFGKLFSPPVDPSQEHVTEAAVKMPDGKVFTGSLHGFARANAMGAGYTRDQVAEGEDGFVTSKGQFLDRQAAFKFAEKIGQLSDYGKQRIREVDRNYDDPSLESVKFGAARQFSPGYADDFSKSNNALDAESEGRFPASEIARRLKVPVGFIKESAPNSGEWHHTSKFYNVTQYYDLQQVKDWLRGEGDYAREGSEPTGGDRLAEYLVNQKALRENPNDVARNVSVKYLEWGGTRSHPKAVERVENGVSLERKPGQQSVVIIRADGTKFRKGLKTTGFELASGETKGAFKPAYLYADSIFKAAKNALDTESRQSNNPAWQHSDDQLKTEAIGELGPNETPMPLKRIATNIGNLKRENSPSSAVGKNSTPIVVRDTQKLSGGKSEATSRKALESEVNIRSLTPSGDIRMVKSDDNKPQPENPVNKQFSPKVEQKPEIGPVWFSQLQKVIEDKMPDRAPVGHIRNLLDPSKGYGVKPDEVKWTGLDDWLNQQRGSVSKKDVLDYLKQNAVEMKEVVKSDQEKRKPRQVNPNHFQWETKRAGDIRFNEGAPDPEERVIVGRHPDEDTYFIIRKAVPEDHVQLPYVVDGDWGGPFEAGSVVEAKQIAADYVERSLQDREEEDRREGWRAARQEPGNTEFSEYQLPGGKNYRELLFQLPGPQRIDFEDWAAAKGIPETDYRINPRSPKRNDLIEQWHAEHPPVEPINYQSPHWDEKNVLAHTRVDDRADVEGRPGLFAEELQSDWHQQGRQKGYISKAPLPDTSKYKVVTTREEDKYTGQRDIEIIDPDGYRVMSRSGFRGTDEQALRGFAIDLQKQESSGGGKVANAPFKNTWHEMVFRRLLRMAAEEGKDWLGWTTGEQQAERYNLSKQVEDIRWGTYGGEKTVVIKPIAHAATSEGKAITLYVDASGKVSTETPQMTGKNLDEIIGKEVSGNILSSDTGSLSGDGLKIGGEGMKGFYDKILVDYANKLGKKFGVRVEDREIPASEKELGSVEGEPIVKQVPATKVHALPVTPEMKASVMKGQAMFSPQVGKSTELHVKKLRPEMARAAQEVYDQWNQDEDGMDEELGGGGICQDIADKIAGVLGDAGIDSGIVSSSVGDQHVWVVAKLNDGVYNIDIPPSVYESGSGYVWKKRHGVSFKPGHVVIDRIDSDPSKFEQYTAD